MFRAADEIGSGTCLKSIMTLLGAGVLVLAGCDMLLEIQDDPNTISGDGIRDEAAFSSRLIGAQSDFAWGVGNAAIHGGLFTDEVFYSGSFIARFDINRRDVHPGNNIMAEGPYTGLQVTAKVSEDLQAEILDGAFPSFVTDPPNSPQFALVSLLSGYSRLYLADLFCTLAFNNRGPELTSSQVYEMVIAEFTNAINAGNAEATVRNAALTGRARAHLQLGNFDAALLDAQQVPEGFAFTLEYSGAGGRENNLIWSLTWGQRRMPAGVYFQALTIDDTDVTDPRTGVVDTGNPSFSGSHRLWASTKFSGPSAPLKVASWEEAQYIIAEIQGGDVARGIINDLRARAGIDIVFDPEGEATEQEILRAVIDEKVRTLYLEGHRMGDLRRLLQQHQIDLFPVEEDSGNQTCMPLPDLERHNNPDLS